MPAFFAVDPDAVVDALWTRFEKKFQEMQGQKSVRYLTVNEAAQIKGVDPKIIRRMIREGVLPAEDTKGRGRMKHQYRIKETDL